VCVISWPKNEVAMKKPALSSILVATLVLALGVIAEAQQTGKLARIGILDPSTASGSAVLVDAFRQELTKLGWIREKTSPSSIGLPSKRMMPA
jgi:hypothetical protein